MNYFYVFQGRSFENDRYHRRLWAPYLTQEGTTHIGYDTICEIKRGDIILHQKDKMLVAVSIALGECHPAIRPKGRVYDEFYGYTDQGRQIATSEYIMIKNPIRPGKYYYSDIRYIQPDVNPPFRRYGNGKFQYLCNMNKELYDFLMRKTADPEVESMVAALIASLPPDPIPPSGNMIDKVKDKCSVYVTVGGKPDVLMINVEKFPAQKVFLGKRVNDVVKTKGMSTDVEYIINKIINTEEQGENEMSEFNEATEEFDDEEMLNKTVDMCEKALDIIDTMLVHSVDLGFSNVLVDYLESRITARLSDYPEYNRYRASELIDRYLDNLLDTQSNEGESKMANKKIGKKNAMELLHKHGYRLRRVVNYAAKNSTQEQYWINPQADALKHDWNIILEDYINRKIYLFEIPANTLSEAAFRTRYNPNSPGILLLDMGINYGDPRFTDSKSGVRFSDFKVTEIDY